MAYTSNDYNSCNSVFQLLVEAGNKFGLVVEEPEWIELGQNFNTEDLDRQLGNYKKHYKKSPVIVVMLVPQENTYQDAKKICYKNGTVSQCIKRYTYNGMTKDQHKGRNIACNVLKQINSKLGGDLFYLKFPEEVTCRKIMLLGIDVCHSGKVSNVGFCASTN